MDDERLMEILGKIASGECVGFVIGISTDEGDSFRYGGTMSQKYGLAAMLMESMECDLQNAVRGEGEDDENRTDSA